jgi:hypothetical protein
VFDTLLPESRVQATEECFDSWGFPSASDSKGSEQEESKKL